MPPDTFVCFYVCTARHRHFRQVTYLQGSPYIFFWLRTRKVRRKEEEMQKLKGAYDKDQAAEASLFCRGNWEGIAKSPCPHLTYVYIYIYFLYIYISIHIYIYILRRHGA